MGAIDLGALEEFERMLRETGSYRTPSDRPRSPAARALGRFDAWFYVGLARTIYSGHCVAARGEWSRQLWAAHAHAVMTRMEDCGATVDISGMENAVGLSGPTVYVGNHMSMIESLILPAILAHVRNFTAVIKESLLRYPFFGTMMGAMGAICVGRRNPREDLEVVLREGKRKLESGLSIMLFPQSTRSATFEPAMFNSLGVKLARSAGVPVTPIALKTDFMGNGTLVKDFGSLDRSKTVYFRVGAPLAVEGTGKKTHELTVQFISENLARWREAEGREAGAVDRG